MGDELAVTVGRTTLESIPLVHYVITKVKESSWGNALLKEGLYKIGVKDGMDIDKCQYCKARREMFCLQPSIFLLYRQV